MARKRIAIEPFVFLTITLLCIGTFTFHFVVITTIDFRSGLTVPL